MYKKTSSILKTLKTIKLARTNIAQAVIDLESKRKKFWVKEKDIPSQFKALVDVDYQPRIFGPMTQEVATKFALFLTKVYSDPRLKILTRGEVIIPLSTNQLSEEDKNLDGLSEEDAKEIMKEGSELWINQWIDLLLTSSTDWGSGVLEDTYKSHLDND